MTGDHFAFWVEEVGDGADGIVHVEFLRAVAPGRVAREVQLRVFAQVNRHHAARCRLRSCLHRLRSNFHDLQPCTVIAAATEIVSHYAGLSKSIFLENDNATVTFFLPSSEILSKHK